MKVYAQRGDLPAGTRLSGCAVSGGTLEDYLRLLMERTGGKLCLILRPEFALFPLPCPAGQGEPLTAEDLRALYQDQPCHFSEPLCTEYFTLLRDGQAHAVLFDSRRSLLEKYRRAEAAGVPMVLVEDPDLRRVLRA